MLWLALGLGLFFAMNIGASGTAAAMSAAYGSGAVRRRPALMLVAVCAFAGALLAGRHVTLTLGRDLLPNIALPAACAAVILASAACTLCMANLSGIPLSTSEVTVGAVVGTAMVLGRPPFAKLAVIVSTWLILPLLCAMLAYLLQRHLGTRLRPHLRGKRPFVALLLTLGGCYEAFAAGANNVANAVGPLLGAGLVPMTAAIVVGGLGLALGAVTMGGRVLNTNAKKITALDLLSGTIVSFTGATLVMIASLFGIPVPLTQVTTMGIVGVGYANGGASALNPLTLRRVAQVWLVSPVVSMAVSFAGSGLVLPDHRPSIGLTVSVLASAAATVMLARHLLRTPAGTPATALPPPASAGEEAL